MLVLRPGALGDTLLALPALRALRRTRSPVRLAAHAGAARLLASLNEVDVGLTFDDPSLGWLFRDGVPEEAVVAWMDPRLAPALRHALLVAPGRPATEQHCAAYLFDSLAPLGLGAEFDAAPLKIRPVWSDEILVHPGSGSVAKNWPPFRFAATIEALDQPVRLVVGEADDQAARQVEACLGRGLARLECAPLPELAARLAGCRAYLGNDSGVSHLAGLTGARTVVLFGPTPSAVWRPLGPRVHIAAFDVGIQYLAAALSG